MAQFPTAIPVIADITAGQTLAAAQHANKHNAMVAEIGAIAAKVGVDGSTEPTTHEKKIADLQSDVASLQAGSTNSVYENEVPTGAVDGANTSFTTANSYVAGSLKVYRNGTRLKGGGEDYTVTAGGFTLALAPPTGTILLVDYMTSAGVSNNADTVDGYHAAGLMDAVKEALYPVGSLYTNVSDSTNPATLLGFGTWASFGAGRVLVGVDSGQTEFDTVGETGGAKTHTLTSAEMPTHTHTQNAHSHDIGPTTSDDGVMDILATQQSTGAWSGWRFEPASTTGTSERKFIATNVTATNNNTGGGGAHNNLQPYITVYMWRRTA